MCFDIQSKRNWLHVQYTLLALPFTATTRATSRWFAEKSRANFARALTLPYLTITDFGVKIFAKITLHSDDESTFIGVLPPFSAFGCNKISYARNVREVAPRRGLDA